MRKPRKVELEKAKLEKDREEQKEKLIQHTLDALTIVMKPGVEDIRAQLSKGESESEWMLRDSDFFGFLEEQRGRYINFNVTDLVGASICQNGTRTLLTKIQKTPRLEAQDETVRWLHQVQVRPGSRPAPSSSPTLSRRSSPSMCRKPGFAPLIPSLAVTKICSRSQEGQKCRRVDHASLSVQDRCCTTCCLEALSCAHPIGHKVVVRSLCHDWSQRIGVSRGHMYVTPASTRRTM